MTRARRPSRSQLAAAFRLWGSKDGEPPPEKETPGLGAAGAEDCREERTAYRRRAPGGRGRP